MAPPLEGETDGAWVRHVAVDRDLFLERDLRAGKEAHGHVWYPPGCIKS
jgi:hypothetical protein